MEQNNLTGVYIFLGFLTFLGIATIFILVDRCRSKKCRKIQVTPQLCYDTCKEKVEVCGPTTFGASSQSGPKILYVHQAGVHKCGGLSFDVSYFPSNPQSAENLVIKTTDNKILVNNGYADTFCVGSYGGIGYNASPTVYVTPIGGVPLVDGQSLILEFLGSSISFKFRAEDPDMCGGLPCIN